MELMQTKIQKVKISFTQQQSKLKLRLSQKQLISFSENNLMRARHEDAATPCIEQN